MSGFLPTSSLVTMEGDYSTIFATNYSSLTDITTGDAVLSFFNEVGLATPLKVSVPGLGVCMGSCN